jgi:hypothetical protein
MPAMGEPCNAERAIDEACDRFEGRWRAGQRPVVEDYLGAVPESARDELLRELLRLEIDYRRRGGEQPALADYLPRWPQQSALLEELLRKVLPAPRPALACPRPPVDLQRTAPFQGTAPAAAHLPQQIGRFQVRARLGAGAFGTVYHAYDPQLDREVALKVPLPGRFDGPQQVERFLREARAAARLRHPHIVPLFEASGQAPHFYLASAFIHGRTLADAVDESPLGFGESARVVRELAEALAYAHGQDIVHRDVKPANVMLDEKGTAHLLDFGLAHRRDGEVRLTQEGGLVGTPAFIAPERIASGSGEVLPASDQYSLGVLFYELLCGRAPFEGPLDVVLFSALHTEPPSPRRLRPTVPRDLETICLKAMAKLPQDRYASCQEMADDLRRWLEGEPIRARPVGALERAVKWARRNVVVSALAAAVFLVLLGGIVVSSCFAVTAREEARAARQAEKDAEELAKAEAEAKGLANRETARADAKAKEAETNLGVALLREKEAKKARGDAEHEANEAKKARADAVREAAAAKAQARRAEDARHAIQIDLALRAREQGDYDRMGALLNEMRPEYHWVWETCHVRNLWLRRAFPIWSFVGHTGPVESVAYSPDGKRVLTGSSDGTARVWDAEMGQQKALLKGHTDRVTSVAYSPDGKRVLTGSQDKTARVWDAETGQQKASLEGHTGPVFSVAYSADGKRVLTGSSDHTAQVWDAETGQKKALLKGHTGPVYSVVFSPNGKFCCCANTDLKRG